MTPIWLHRIDMDLTALTFKAVLVVNGEDLTLDVSHQTAAFLLQSSKECNHLVNHYSIGETTLSTIFNNPIQS